MHKFDLIIIGQGITGSTFLFDLTKEAQHLGKKLTIGIVADSKLHPSCSESSLAIVASNGIDSQKGEWGKVLLEAVRSFQCFVKEYNPDGVYSCSLFHIKTHSGPDESKFVRRFFHLNNNSEKFKNISPNLSYPLEGVKEEAFALDVKDLLDWQVKESLKTNASITFFDFPVANIASMSDGYKISSAFSNHEPIFAQSLFMGMNQYEDKTKKVAGSYYQWHLHDDNFSPKSFCLAWKDVRLSYIADKKILKLGSTTNKEEIETPNLELLNQYYHEFCRCISPAFNLTLPSIKEAQLKTGIRAMGPKRRPVIINEISEKGWLGGLMGTYKNGMSLPFLYARDFTRSYFEFKKKAPH